MICWKRYSDAPKPPTTSTFCKQSQYDRSSGIQVFASTHLKKSVLRLNGDDLVPNKLQNPVDDRLETLQDLLVGEGHVTFLDTSLREFSFDAHIDSPLLTVIPEVGLYPVLEVHDTFGVNLASDLRAIGKLHLADLCAEDVGEITVQRCRTARITRTSRALCDRERRLLLHFVGDQIDGTTTAVDNEDRIVYLQIQQTSLRAEHGGGFGFSDEGETVIVLIAEEASLDRSGSRRSFTCIIPDGRDCEEVSNVALFSVEHFTQALLQLIAHSLSQLEEVVCCNVDFRLSWRKRGKVDRVDVGVSGKHQLQLEPFHLLNAWLGVAGGRERIRNVRTPANNLLVLIVVKNGGNLYTINVSEDREM